MAIYLYALGSFVEQGIVFYTNNTCYHNVVKLDENFQLSNLIIVVLSKITHVVIAKEPYYAFVLEYATINFLFPHATKFSQIEQELLVGIWSFMSPDQLVSENLSTFELLYLLDNIPFLGNMWRYMSILCVVATC